jgi:uncharacterized protein (DUF2147 family)
MNLVRTIATAAITLLLAAPSFAQGPSPVGTWQTSTGESRYSVSYCGDGSQLCAKLIWLRSDAKKPANLAQLNKMVVNGAKAIAANKWRGTVTYEGKRVSGSVTLVNKNRMKLSGCAFIACKSVDFVRI